MEVEVGEYMKKNTKVRKLEGYNNVFVFPGLLERLLKEGYEAVLKSNYPKAVKDLEKANELQPLADFYLLPYATALYETKNFERAKEVVILALEREVGDYFAMMELFLLILLQLEAYDEVEIHMDLLFKEGGIPPELYEKFTYLRELNQRQMTRYGKEEVAQTTEVFSFTYFEEADFLSQHHLLSALNEGEVRQSIDLLMKIVEATQFAPSIVSSALSKLVEIQYESPVTVTKFGRQRTVIPHELSQIGESPMIQEVLLLVANKLEKDPIQAEFAHECIQKFIVEAFPFEWEDCTAEEVADTYIEYVRHMMQGTPLQSTSLLKFIEKVDKEIDF